MLEILNFAYVSSDFAQSACTNIILLRSRDILALYIPAHVQHRNYCFFGSENVFYRISFFRILACCCFYFPTTMVLMYCYGSAFHVNKLRLKRVVCVNTPEVVSSGHIERVSQVYSLCEWNSNRQAIRLAIINKTIPSNIKRKHRQIIRYKVRCVVCKIDVSQIKYRLLSFMFVTVKKNHT